MSADLAPRPGAAHGRWQAWGRILLAVPQGWRNRGSAWWSWLLPLVLLGLPLVLSVWAGRRAAVYALLLGLSVLLVGLWSGLVYGLMLQNKATAARLVPGHVQRLREVLALAWALGLGVVAAVTWQMEGPVLKTVTAFAVVMLWLALLTRWTLLAVLLTFVPPWLGLNLAAGLRRVASVLGEFTEPAAVLAAVLLGWLLGGLLGTGGGAHVRQQARLGAWRRSLDDGGALPLDAGGLWGWVARIASWPYQRTFTQLTQAPRRSVWPRLQLVFGPANHWRVHAAWAAVVAGIGLVVLAWLQHQGLVGGGRSLIAAQVLGPALGVAGMAIHPVTGLLTAAARSRREQALLALLPGVPQGPALSRGLAWRWLLHFGLAWLLAATLLMGFTGVAAPELQPTVLAGLAGLWPLASLLLTDLSRLSAEPGSKLGVAIGAFFLLPSLAALAHLRLAWPVLAIVGGFAVITAALLVWRWQVLGRRPGAFPACRLA